METMYMLGFLICGWVLSNTLWDYRLQRKKAQQIDRWDEIIDQHEREHGNAITWLYKSTNNTQEKDNG